MFLISSYDAPLAQRAFLLALHSFIIIILILFLFYSFIQVPDEKFLVLINDLLASGEIPGLFADDELENIINGLRNEVKGAGIQDTKENVWKFFIDRVRRQLKVILSTCLHNYRVFLPCLLQICASSCTSTCSCISVRLGNNVACRI